ncbi:hypothetical protein [uncultured Shewanella sp.]|uniref:hypothetical protein n=1 Tax=uncultured Shewanella sp. TaxID=173975 RepID=UPI00262994B8|nr:hypothetical protein [uncultured Shewanella sp.]
MRNIIVSVSLFILAACATDLSQVNTPNNKATIVAFEDSSFQFLVPLSTSASTKIEYVNGKKVSDFFTSTHILHLDPGPHQLIVSCLIFYSGRSYSNDIEHQMVLEANKQYVFTAHLSPNHGCIAKYDVNEITTQ